MSNREGFSSGFLAGAAIGGLVGAVLGVVLSRRSAEAPQEPDSKPMKGKQRQIEAERIEIARLSLEDKIAQLNEAIDDVRQQLGSVNGNFAAENPERAIAEDS